MQLPADQLQQYVEAARKEERAWQTWGSVEPIGHAEAKKIMADPGMRTRILRSRACFRNKRKLPDKLVAKARVVALGHLDPDLHRISREPDAKQDIGVRPPRGVRRRRQRPVAELAHQVALVER